MLGASSGRTLSAIQRASTILTDLSGRKGEHDRGRRFLRRIQVKPVEIEKHDH